MAKLGRRSSLIGVGVAAALGSLGRGRAQGTKVAVATQLGWLRNGEYAPLMVAEAMGFFDAEGIAHHIFDGGAGKNPVPIVAVGQAQFGLATSGLHLLAARTARDPVDVVAVGTLYQTSPAAYLSLGLPADPDPTPKDLEGKRVGVQAGSEYFLTAMARQNGVDDAKIRVVTVQADADPLLVGRVDFFSGWVTNQAYQIEQAAAEPDAPPALRGKTWKAIRFDRWGLRAYSDVIFCTAQTAKEQPAMVRGYLRAVGRAISFIEANPEAALKLVASFPNQIETAPKLAWRWRVQNPLFASAATTERGPLWMEPAVWDGMAGFFYDAGQVPRRVAAAEVMTDSLLPGVPAG